MNSISQGTLIYIDFEPSKGSEIKKRRPAIVISRDEYNLASNLVIVCPITSTDKDRPYFVPINNKNLKPNSKVNTKQVYSLDYTERAGRNIQIIGKITNKELMNIAQHFLMNFNFNF
ncbi:type II toxin-antitoxin system PemK/MazF family toxin [Mammaliicoccus sciuri]|jgi:mRNA interferase MazF|uniref:Endoribonuclease MazF n=2 Tax=Mammaliicoccus sciuri TaxID=1296 RepID=A0AAW5LT30_MAMSC|nr:type II toxin-antitoxin system PemK/MazF family toxin [Mammaliicoccus sciuri]HDK8090591.1 type II toxin-antitoxin system PemK/MazF family toxin [Staphylococcus aureus]MBG9207017.1 type II toxin-antitoxin system PemK/MazF family toxin [Mammaliicoccus sciuri]MBO3081133.1 type II toxin-antitoxin system PemK/MazF family toxin [Mammaliicoccus sciuri]MCD8875449.1 type II toxin-antitoxin system PemK/MazF family toxin [Mammaliicoccus sciuri]MCD8898545.1 type II toxin-antitoxin system PemK/MazF fami